MPRKLKLATHYSPEELKQRYRSAQDPVESRRWHLLWLVSTEQTLTSAARVVGLNYDYARDIVRHYNTDKAEGVRNRLKDKRPQGGRNALLNAEQREELRQKLLSPPPDQGLWNGPKVAQVIAQMLGQKKVWPQRGWDYLKLLGYSHQRPRPRHAKTSVVEQEAFKKNSLPAKLN